MLIFVWFEHSFLDMTKDTGYYSQSEKKLQMEPGVEKEEPF